MAASRRDTNDRMLFNRTGTVLELTSTLWRLWGGSYIYLDPFADPVQSVSSPIHFINFDDQLCILIRYVRQLGCLFDGRLRLVNEMEQALALKVGD